MLDNLGWQLQELGVPWASTGRPTDSCLDSGPQGQVPGGIFLKDLFGAQHIEGLVNACCSSTS